MNIKTKIQIAFLTIFAIFIVGTFIWIYLEYGEGGVGLTIFGLLVIACIVYWVYLEANKPSQKTYLSPLEQAERDKGYYHEIGRIEAQNEYGYPNRNRNVVVVNNYRHNIRQPSYQSRELDYWGNFWGNTKGKKNPPRFF